MSLGRIVGIMGLAGCLLIGLALALIGLDQRTQMRREAQQQIQSTTYLLADHAGRLFEVSDVALQNAGAMVKGRNWSDVTASEDIFKQLTIASRSLPYIEDVWLNDETGALRQTSFRFPAPFSDASDRDSFLAVREPMSSMFVGERIIGRVTKRPTFLVARRLEAEDGAFRGMVSVTADLAYFNDYWRRVRLPFDTRVSLVRAPRLDVLAQHPAPATEDAFVPLPDDLVRRAMADPAVALSFRIEEPSGPRLASLERVGTLPLYVVLSASEAAIDAAWLDRMGLYSAFAAAALAALVLLTLLAFRQARRERAASRALDAARQALANANSGLEATVAERTSDLRASEARFRLILESATDYAIITTDPSGAVTEWNEGARNLLGWERSEALGQHVRIIFTPEDRVAGVPEAEFVQALQQGRSLDERWHQRADGSRFFATGTLLPMGSDGGGPIGFLKILRDRTEQFAVEEARRTMNETLERLVGERTAELAAANERLVAEAAQRERAEEQLRQSQKMEAVGRLTGGVAHDFNNLLTVVTGNLDMLRRRLGTQAEPRILRLIDHALEGATRAAALTYRLLAFSRQQPLAPVAIDCNKLVSGISDLLQRTLGENIQVETTLAEGLWLTHADPNQLENAILNLAVNARDAMPEGGRLTIETSNATLAEAEAGSAEKARPGPYVMIGVRDTGSGMSADTIAKAFEPFFTTKPVGKGTGLGLSQVYGFARQSNGFAEICSALGEGTTVRIYLPRLDEAEADALHPVEQAAPASASRGRQESILVVEDEQMVREFSSTVLEDEGYRVIAAEDGPSGLAALDAHPEIRLLFTDVVLTGPLNGRKVAEEALSRRPGLKVLFTTGYTPDAIVHHGKLDDDVEFIGKPFTAQDLAARVRRILDS
ncbi:MAG: PAS domain S-box protein [Alsobacter sp.]